MSIDWIEDGNLNRWRFKIGSNEEYIEIELTSNKFATCQYIYFDMIQTRKWYASRASTKRETWYAYSKGCDAETGKRVSMSMHHFLFPHIPSPIDHIDGDGLNNIITNVRCGSHSINARNKHDVSGVYERGTSIIAQWYDSTGKHCCETFSKASFDTVEEARAAAQESRDRHALEAFNAKLAMQAADPKPPRVVRELAPRKKNRAEVQIDVVGLSYQAPKSGASPVVIGCLTINKIRFKQVFTLSKFDNSFDAAVEAGTAWVEKIKRENPKKRKIDEI